MPRGLFKLRPFSAVITILTLTLQSKLLTPHEAFHCFVQNFDVISYIEIFDGPHRRLIFYKWLIKKSRLDIVFKQKKNLLSLSQALTSLILSLAGVLVCPIVTWANLWYSFSIKVSCV